jgi:hypothetical protein
VLSLLDCTPTELRAIAAFADDPGVFEPLIDAGIRPVVEDGGENHDVLIGFERFEDEALIYDGDEPIGVVLG